MYLHEWPRFRKKASLFKIVMHILKDGLNGFLRSGPHQTVLLVNTERLSAFKAVVCHTRLVNKVQMHLGVFLVVLSHFKLTFDVVCVVFVCFAFKNPHGSCKHATLQASVPISCDSSPLGNGSMKGQHRDLFVWQLLLTAMVSSALAHLLVFCSCSVNKSSRRVSFVLLPYCNRQVESGYFAFSLFFGSSKWMVLPLASLSFWPFSIVTQQTCHTMMLLGSKSFLFFN